MAVDPITSFEVCAGGGGQALGLEWAGFRHVGLLDNDRNACATLRYNRPDWRAHLADLRDFDGVPYRGRVRLLSGGVPCPPFSVAGTQRGADDERDLMPQMLRLAAEIKPDAVMVENVRGLLSPKFAHYRARVRSCFESMGYVLFDWKVVQAVDYGVPQLRPRAVLVALRRPFDERFQWPEESDERLSPTVGEALLDLMGSAGWEGAAEWATMADGIAPTLVGGSKKHGGPDLGPTRARMAWAELGVDGRSLSDVPPPVGFVGLPKLTLRMAARLQGFPDDWQFVGSKTHAYRQIGNALPPPVAQAVGGRIAYALQRPDDAMAHEYSATYFVGPWEYEHYSRTGGRSLDRARTCSGFKGVARTVCRAQAGSCVSNWRNVCNAYRAAIEFRQLAWSEGRNWNIKNGPRRFVMGGDAGRLHVTARGCGGGYRSRL